MSTDSYNDDWGPPDGDYEIVRRPRRNIATADDFEVMGKPLQTTKFEKENSSMKYRLNNVRLAFGNLFKPKAFEAGGEASFGGSFIMAKNHADVKGVEKAIEAVGSEKWGAKWPTVKKELLAKDKTCLHDGDGKAQYDGFEGNMFVAASNKTQPALLGANKEELKTDTGVIYSGCYVNAMIDIWAQDNQYGKRINASLTGVQYRTKGDAFSGGRPADANDFDDMSSEDDSSELV